MVMQRNKSVMEGNIFHSNNQRLNITGIPEGMQIVQRDAISIEQDVVELQDKRKVPSGRNNPGEFNAQLQLASDVTRNSMLAWYSLCLDPGQGISPNYKRQATLSYERLFSGSPGSDYEGSGNNLQRFQLKIIGLWCKSIEFPEFTMDGTEHSLMSVGFCFDDIDPVFDQAVTSAIGGLVSTQKIGPIDQRRR